ncbi:hypothetical protein GGI21_001760 [Coemansia aciculifera]|uniref:Uncharacterized protein n=1 Tax=Coemansia aciculifera TaxID=417176 RepID=A0ACC1M3V2_9FUNG|nr:hypothetical protein IWW38_002580 [Coemansia aciculifera]KAJ2909560.1 hypothetical protein GGI21_001760 [Coemansia aciculifera]
MSNQPNMFETPTTHNTMPRFKGRSGTESRFASPTSAKSPSRRLKDLFFAAYTSGADAGASNKRNGSGSIDSRLTSATLQTPTKKLLPTPSALVAKQVEADDSMDVDMDDNTAATDSHISEDDLRGPVVPLAISTAGRFYSDHMRRCELRIELMGLSTLGHNPRGVYVMPSLTSINVWHGVMFVKRGYWRDAVIRFRIDIPREYPKAHPIISLSTSVAHPLVRLEDGRFALEQQFPQWTPYSDYIFHALHYLKNAFKNRVLKELQPRDCYNIGAYMKFKNDLPQFQEHARIDSMKSRMPESLYKAQPQDCPIMFSQLTDQQYEATLQQMSAFATASKQLSN